MTYTSFKELLVLHFEVAAPNTPGATQVVNAWVKEKGPITADTKQWAKYLIDREDSAMYDLNVTHSFSYIRTAFNLDNNEGSMGVYCMSLLTVNSTGDDIFECDFITGDVTPRKDPDSPILPPGA